MTGPLPDRLPGPCELPEQRERELREIEGGRRASWAKAGQQETQTVTGWDGTGPVPPGFTTEAGEGRRRVRQHFGDDSGKGSRCPGLGPLRTGAWSPQEERPSQRVDDLPTTRFSTAASEACSHGRRARRARTGESKQRSRGTGQDGPASAQRCLPGPHGTHRDAEEQPRAPRPGPRGCSGKERQTPSLRPGTGRGAAATRDAGCAVRPAFRTSSGFFWYK